MRRIDKSTFVFAILTLSICYISFDYRIKANSSKNKDQSIKDSGYIAQNRFLQVADIPDFDFYDNVGRWRRFSKKDSILSFGLGRPSSGWNETSYNIYTGTITTSWDIMGMGHGKQVVEPLL
ncbi:MAG TPA: hypothetical protein VGD14_15130, partial [bacterium]